MNDQIVIPNPTDLTIIPHRRPLVNNLGIMALLTVETRIVHLPPQEQRHNDNV